MLGCKDPSSYPSGLTSQLPSPRKIFSLKIILTMMPWLYIVSSSDFWSTMFWLTQAAQRTSSLQRLSDRCKSQKTRYIHDATHPLCGFGGRQIVALGKITMSVTFGYVHNTRTEQVVFDIIDMEYPYNAIIGRGTLNAFEAILHPAYLCMKIPSEKDPLLFTGFKKLPGRPKGARRIQRLSIT
jgi:hypothetical protein